MKKLLHLLKLPEELRLEDLNNPRNHVKIKQIISRKPLLQKCYESFYKNICDRIVPTEGKVIIELGSGCSNFQHYLPTLITSDILNYPHVQEVFSALDIPYATESVDAFVMIDVLHHLSDCRKALQEMARCLKLGGKIVMIEPARTPWSSFIYHNFHHEDFNIGGGWDAPVGGALTEANMAIPWIIFERDRQQFVETFPNLQITDLQLHTPISYLISGGLSLRQLVPSYLIPLVLGLESSLQPLLGYLAMFMTIELTKSELQT